MPRNILFICTQNRLRSPTAEQVFAEWPGVETASAGLGNDAEVPVSPELLAWADMIFVMEKAHRNRLSAKFVIHTVGPIWRGGARNEEATLANAYRNSLSEAVRVGAKTVAFPAISTGVYHFPPARAAEIAVETVAEFLREHGEIEEVRLVCFSQDSVLYHEEALKKIAGA